MTIHSFGYYEKYIQSTFIKNHVGINLDASSLELSNSIKILVESDIALVNYSEEIKSKIKSVIKLKKAKHKPLWLKINIMDQAVNEYVGIGFLNIERSWVEFILGYLDNDRADQMGDTVFVLFDIEFKWASSFTLSQEDKAIYIKHYS